MKITMPDGKKEEFKFNLGCAWFAIPAGILMLSVAAWISAHAWRIIHGG